MSMVGYSVAEKVAKIELSRPPVNALSSEAFAQLGEAASEASNDEQIHAVILTGTGDAFCGGADTDELEALTPVERSELFALTTETRRRFSSIPVPVIAAINGPAAGAGVSYAALCDYRIASSNAFFRMPEIELGSVAGGGASLMSIGVSPGTIRMMLLGGTRVSAEEAVRVHLVDEVVPLELLSETASTRAATFAAKPREYLVAMKQAIGLASANAGATDVILRRTQAMTLELAGKVEVSESELPRQQKAGETERYKTIMAERVDAIGRIVLDRPRVLNAMNNTMLEELDRALRRFDEDPDVRVVVVTGSGRAFSAGRDANEIGEPFHRSGARVWETIEKLDTPVIAAVNGLCYTGALSMLLCFDLIIASDRASFADTHAKLGMRHGGGSTQRLRDSIGKLMAKELLFTCEPIDAAQALRIGLVNRVVPHDELIEHTMELAHTISRNDPETIGATKRLINAGALWGTPLGLQLEESEYRSQRRAVTEGRQSIEVQTKERS